MDQQTPVRRRYVYSAGRHVHYLRCGSGPPVVLVHPGIANAELFLPQIRRLATRYTCFAFDNAGFGGSDGLELPEVSMADLADALAGALRELGFPPAPVFGYHTGAAVALELAVRHRDLVSALLLDGLPIFRPEETERLFRGNFAPALQVDALGGHFFSSWTRFRDQATFYPWHEKTPETVLPVAVGATPEAIHTWVCWFFRSARHYASPFRTAHTFGAVAAQRLAALEVPGRFFVASNDLLSRHFDRFPPLPEGTSNRLLGAEPAEKEAALDAALAEFASGVAPPDPGVPAAGDAIRRHYLDLDAGQVLVRSAGHANAPPLLLLHDAPGSAGLDQLLIRSLARHFRVIAPDLPGCGESDPLPAMPAATDYADVLAQLCKAYGLRGAVGYGTGFGGVLAIELARRYPALTNRLVLRGVLLASEEERAEMQERYTPSIALDPAGAHWYRTWLMLRDSLVYWPWYRRTRAALRRVPADFSAQRLHDWTFEVMKQREGWSQPIQAALGLDVGAALERLEAPTLLATDALHPFATYDARVMRRFPSLQRLPVSCDSRQHADDLAGWAGQS
jgi:pimeloyl-ACP methyl ester carboxylesterase